LTKPPSTEKRVVEQLAGIDALLGAKRDHRVDDRHRRAKALQQRRRPRIDDARWCARARSRYSAVTVLVPDLLA